MRLATGEMLSEKQAAFDAARSLLPGRYHPALLEDPVVGLPLRNCLLLTELPHLITDLGLSPEEVLWSRYYWFLTFPKLRQAAAGYDAGLEQQAFQILEYPHPNCCPDFSVCAAVEAQVEREVGAFLQQHGG